MSKLKLKAKSMKVLMCSTLIFLAACSSGGTDKGATGDSKGKTPAPAPAEEKPYSAPKTPHTLTIYAPGVSVDELNTRFKAPLEKKFPHITFKFETGGTGNNIQDRVARGEIPDIIRMDIPTIYTNYLNYDLGTDLTPFIQKYKYDMNRFNKTFAQEIVDVVRDGKIYGLPVPPFFPNVLYYNIDLFDKFGVPYPKDGMTWDDVYELTKKLAREEGGTVYKGFSMNILGNLRDNAFSHPILDPEKDGLANQDVWQKVFNNLLRFYSIPNNPIGKTSTEETNSFTSGKAAMSANLHSVYLIIPETVNWNIVSLPTMTGAPKRVSQRGPAYLAIAKTSKNQDSAFEVMMEMLSDEVQMQDSMNGIPTTLNNKQIQDALGKNHPVYKSKNMKAVTFYEPTDPTPKRKPGNVDVPLSTQQNLMINTFIDVASNKKDLNTALRDADEALRKAVEAERAKTQK